MIINWNDTPKSAKLNWNDINGSIERMDVICFSNTNGDNKLERYPKGAKLNWNDINDDANIETLNTSFVLFDFLPG